MRARQLIRWFGVLPLVAGLASLAGAFNGCAGESDPTADPPAVGRSVQPVEWVGFHTEVPMKPEELIALASGLFGADAQAGKLIADRELTLNHFVTAEAETSTPDQVRLTFAVNDGEHERRALAVAPASFARGKLFVDTISAALGKMQADNAEKEGSGHAFLLEYRVYSAQGGTLSFGVRGDRGKYALVLDVSSPRTSLKQDRIGKAAESATPYDSVAGTVWFDMTKDDFDFFVDRAYGKGATGKQNFKDFALVPHEWLRLTVEPELEKKIVNVGFELLTLDGRRVHVAKAPASILAGDLFKAMVDRNMANMLEQELNAPGSSTPWEAPFYYDSPESGGVVKVVARGEKGKFSVAYAVESPRTELIDVPFVEYVPVEFAPPDPSETAACDELGDPNIKPAPKGVFDIRFKASDVILDSMELKGPLKGTIQCAVYHASDVKITGPLPGAEAVQEFEIPDADLEASAAPTFTTDEFFGGEYQILCAQDLDESGGASKGDPVTFPIGGYTVACNINPVVVEFAILNPQD